MGGAKLTVRSLTFYCRLLALFFNLRGLHHHCSVTPQCDLVPICSLSCISGMSVADQYAVIILNHMKHERESFFLKKTRCCTHLHKVIGCTFNPFKLAKEK